MFTKKMNFYDIFRKFKSLINSKDMDKNSKRCLVCRCECSGFLLFTKNIYNSEKNNWITEVELSGEDWTEKDDAFMYRLIEKGVCRWCLHNSEDHNLKAVH